MEINSASKQKKQNLFTFEGERQTLEWKDGQRIICVAFLRFLSSFQSMLQFYNISGRLSNKEVHHTGFKVVGDM